MMAVKSRPLSEPQVGVRSWIRRHPVASFIVLAYAITWLAWLPAMLGYRGDLGQVLMMIAQFGPALAALFIFWYTGASIRSWAGSIIRWRVGLWWYAVALGLPVALIGVQGALFALLGYPLDMPSIPGGWSISCPRRSYSLSSPGWAKNPAGAASRCHAWKPAMHRCSRRRSLALSGRCGTCRWSSSTRGS